MRGEGIHPAAQCPRTLRPHPAAPWVPGAGRYTLGIRCLRHSGQGKAAQPGGLDPESGAFGPPDCRKCHRADPLPVSYFPW